MEYQQAVQGHRQGSRRSHLFTFIITIMYYYVLYYIFIVIMYYNYILYVIIMYYNYIMYYYAL